MIVRVWYVHVDDALTVCNERGRQVHLDVELKHEDDPYVESTLRCGRCRGEYRVTGRERLHDLDEVAREIVGEGWIAETREPFMDGRHHYSIRKDGKPGVRFSVTCLPEEQERLVALLNDGSYS